MSPYGTNLNYDVNKGIINGVQNWLYYAKFYYYILEWDLISSLLTARHNRNNYNVLNISNGNYDKSNDKNKYFNGIYRITLKDLKEKKNMDIDLILSIKDVMKVYYDIINGDNKFIVIK